MIKKKQLTDPDAFGTENIMNKVSNGEGERESFPSWYK